MATSDFLSRVTLENNQQKNLILPTIESSTIQGPFIKTIITLFAILLSSQSTWAETKKPTPTPAVSTEEKKPVEEKEKEVVIVYRGEPDSETRRMEGNYKYQFNVGYASIEYVGIGAATVGLGYVLNPKSMISLKYANQNGSEDDRATKMRSLTLGYKRFMGNSFNIMPAVYYRRSKSEHLDKGIFTPGLSKLTYEDVGVGLRIGNEWQWKNFTLGADWIGLNAKVIQINKEKHNSSDGFDLFSIEEDITLTLLSVYIGYTF